MEKKETVQARTGAGAADDPFREMVAFQTQGLKALTGMNTAWFEAVSDMGSEVMSFLAERIQEDVKTQHQMLHCKDAGELQKIQAEFIQKAIDQYTLETGKLVEMSQKVFETSDSDA